MPTRFTDFRATLDELLPEAWPPDDPTVNSVVAEDVIIFAVESEPTGNYTETRQELINAKVLSVKSSTPLTP